ncbi:MAG: GNAT family N-acetyltransferase [Firmicutes bacterium]|nr:GNAT family N-acetyltransferase [Bacillota bacterium]
MKFIIDEMKNCDWNEVKSIYLEGIITGIATFQTEAPSFEDWDSGHLKDCRFVARCDGKVVGWLALSPTSSRDCYRGVVEVSVYVDGRYQGNGIGKSLLNTVIEASEKKGIWSLYCAIIKENIGSIELHKKCCFREIGHRERIAKMPGGKWHDVVLLERRSELF